MHARPLALSVGCAGLVIAGCSATVGGHGGVATAPSATSTPAFPSAAPASRAAAARFARAPSSTAIGDPPMTDLCSVVDDASFDRPGYHAQFAWEQYPPGCEVDLMSSARTAVEVSAYAIPDRPDYVAGRTSRRVAGQVVYAYPYHGGDCERDVAARGVTLVVETETHSATGRVKPDRAVNCAASDRMAAQLATGIAKRAFARLRSATPSILSLDACRVAQAAGWSSIPELDGTPPYPADFDAGCGIDSDSASIDVDPVVAHEDSVGTASTITAGGHRLYAFDDNDATDCEFVSIQGTTSDRRHEALDLTAHDDAGHPGFCARIATAFGRYLTAAGLR